MRPVIYAGDTLRLQIELEQPADWTGALITLALLDWVGVIGDQ